MIPPLGKYIFVLFLEAWSAVPVGMPLHSDELSTSEHSSNRCSFVELRKSLSREIPWRNMISGNRERYWKGATCVELGPGYSMAVLWGTG